MRADRERGFGEGLGSVHVHADPDAATVAKDVGALAFAVGDDIGFAAGAYRPATPAGQALLADEVAHTLQQRTGARPARGPALESDAQSLVTGGGWSPLGTSGLRLQRCNGAMAVSTTHARDDLRRLADEQASPRRVATLSRTGRPER